MNKDNPAQMYREFGGVGFVCANYTKYDIYVTYYLELRNTMSIYCTSPANVELVVWTF
jgi:hypothetical protein